MTALIRSDIAPANIYPAAPYRARPVALETMDDALRYAKVIAASGLLPKSFYETRDADPTAAAFVAIQLGAEVGLSPMASVQNIAVINGKPGLYGPAMLAVVEASGKLEDFAEWIDGEGDKMVAYCRVKRFGRPERITSFSWDDAKKANLTGKRGPWTEYPRRMMQARARSFALRDTFPDVLAGLGQGSVEELQDIPAEPRDVTPSIEPAKINTAPPPATFSVKVPYGGEPVIFPRNRGGAKAALKEIVSAFNDGYRDIVTLNNDVLDEIAERIPAMAEEIAEFRADAAEALAPKDEPEPEDEDDFPGDIPTPPQP